MLDDEDVNEMIGVRLAGGLPEEAIDLYTVCYTFQKGSASAQSKLEDVHQEPQGKCTICMEEFTTGDCLRCLPCLHAYHVPCIDKWLSLSQSCPVCKHNVMARTTPCFDSPTGQMRCPIRPILPWHFNRPRPSFQVVPRLPLLRGGPLPPSQAARLAARPGPGAPGGPALPAPGVPGVPGVPASSTAVPVYRGAAAASRLAPMLPVARLGQPQMPQITRMAQMPQAPMASMTGISPGIATTTGQSAPRIQPQSEESESESSSSGTSSSGSSTP